MRKIKGLKRMRGEEEKEKGRRTLCSKDVHDAAGHMENK